MIRIVAIHLIVSLRNDNIIFLHAWPPRYVTVVRSSFCFDVSGHAKQRNFLSVVLKMNNDQEELVSSAVYKYDTSTNAALSLL